MYKNRVYCKMKRFQEKQWSIQEMWSTDIPNRRTVVGFMYEDKGIL